MKILKISPKKLIFFLPSLFLILYLILYFYFQLTELKLKNKNLIQEKSTLENQLKENQKELEEIKNQDQILLNKQLEEKIKNIKITYQKSIEIYEKLLDIKTLIKKTDRLDALYAQAVNFLSKENYASAAGILENLEKQINELKEKTISQTSENLINTNIPPSSGYQRQKVNIDLGLFAVDIISANLNSTRVIVDTASDSDCRNDCPVLPLADYVARNNAFAGINGSYFCPASYPSCSDKKNSFDTLLMNKNKYYFNSENNVYSTVPAAIFMGNTARFVEKSLEWGRDTNVDAVIANRPLLLLNGQIVFEEDGDSKHIGKGNRSFVGNTGETVYIGVVHNATVAESAKVLNALGIQNALNLDDGGSTALWYGGYKVGPGRNIPNALLLVRK